MTEIHVNTLVQRVSVWYERYRFTILEFSLHLQSVVLFCWNCFAFSGDLSDLSFLQIGSDRYVTAPDHSVVMRRRKKHVSIRCQIMLRL